MNWSFQFFLELVLYFFSQFKCFCDTLSKYLLVKDYFHSAKKLIKLVVIFMLYVRAYTKCIIKQNELEF